MGYTFLDELSRADVAYEAEGSDLAGMFESAALALEATQVEDLEAVRGRTMKRVEVDGDGVEQVLFNFLQELIYLKDAELLLFSQVEVEEVSEDGCQAVLWGERLDPEKHELKVDVKAVTMHKFGIEELDDGWKATVVLDV